MRALYEQRPAEPPLDTTLLDLTGEDTCEPGYDLDDPGRVFAVRFSDGISFTLAETSEAPLRAVRGP